MSDARFNVVFSGQLVRGADPATVKANLGRVFKMDAARVEKLFSGQPVVLKKEADQATAMKFRAVLKQAGAECELKPSAPAAAPTSPPPVEQAGNGAAKTTASNAPAVDADQESGELETVGTIRTGGTGFSGAFTVADVGADMDNSDHQPPPDAPDVSHLSMAAAGEDLGQKKDQRAEVKPDISHLSLKDD
ncbi:MAG: hypothetical protein CL537_03615 [Alcanivoracaceae bacterium]|nr:hypothetical protein [Alcanivoracaceae bacterium]MCG8437152.1 hypothetical protein [Pseudomonadales bacterium]MED5432831.1 hypothetical protein [Pseudomonadota bacterium]MEE2870312.1 hypothetical protein [Pseudomonadota bacterium]